jgi:hypothetical protein
LGNRASRDFQDCGATRGLTAPVPLLERGKGSCGSVMSTNRTRHALTSRPIPLSCCSMKPLGCKGLKWGRMNQPVMRLMQLVTGFAVLGLLTGFAGCVEWSAENTSSGQTAGGSSPTSFTRSGNVGYQSNTEHHDWENPASKASYTVSVNLGGGSLTVELRDADGTRVGSERFTGYGQSTRSGTTDAGAPGTWEVVIIASQTTGQYQINARSA